MRFCNWLGYSVSSFSLTMLNIDKLIYFQFPLKYNLFISKKRSFIICIVIWIISLGYDIVYNCIIYFIVSRFISYLWAFKHIHLTENCSIDLAHGKYDYNILFFITCVLPVGSSLLVSIYLFRLTRKMISAPSHPRGGSNIDMPTFKIKVSLRRIFKITLFSR